MAMGFKNHDLFTPELSSQNNFETPFQPQIEAEKPERDGLEILDTLPVIEEGEVSNQMLTDVFTGLSEEGMKMANQIIEDHDQPPHPPASFDEMLDTSLGSYWQRAKKAWIKPRDPEGTIKLMEALQVDEFLKLPLLLNKLLRKSAHKENYHLKDGSVVSMLDFATNKTLFNEAIHLASLPYNALCMVPFIASGQKPELAAFNLALFAINTYCVLGQRYTRARLSRVVDRALSRNREFDFTKYNNKLGLKLEKKDDKNE